MTAGREELLDRVFRPRPDVVHVEVDGETVAFQPEHESLTVLDPVGTVIWTLLDGTVSLRRLCEELADAYRAPAQQVQADVLLLVSQLQQDELLSDLTGR